MTVNAVCPYCNMTTGGQHEANCPSYRTVTITQLNGTPVFSFPANVQQMGGWLCPRCKAVNAPWVQQCSCRDDPC
jgi:hypothetical protein